MRSCERHDRVLKLVQQALFDDGIKADINECEPLIPELLSQAVLPLAKLNDNPNWRKQYNQIIARNMEISYEHTELHELLAANDIPYVALKGVASASYYPNPIFRTMGDVDFLVNETDMTRAASLLESAGFVKAVEDDSDGIHAAFHREDSIWEMHRSINGVPPGLGGDIIRRYITDIIDTAVEYDEGNGIIKIPDHFHHGLILLLHTASHLTSEGVGLRHLCDWAVFVNHFSDEQYRTLFEEKLKACGLWRFAQLLSLVSVKYLKLTYQPWMGEADDSLLEQLITDIMDGGNFGYKDEDRYRQIKYISNRGEHTVDQKSAILQLWHTISRKAESQGKSRLAVIGDYVSMVLGGERELDSRSTMKHAAERKKLYSEFHLFEI